MVGLFHSIHDHLNINLYTDLGLDKRITAVVIEYAKLRAFAIESACMLTHPLIHSSNLLTIPLKI